MSLYSDDLYPFHQFSEVSPLATVATVMDTTATPPPGDVDNCDVEDTNNSLVEVYADRLCAVTHAFALCCSTLQKSSGRLVCMLAHPPVHKAFLHSKGDILDFFSL